MVSRKVRVGIIGAGNVGTDLMYKVERSPWLEMSVMIGKSPESNGLKQARERGYHTFDSGVERMLDHADLADIYFDATTAKAHATHHRLLSSHGKRVIDLTPAAIGPFVVPSLNLRQYLGEVNVNLVTCGGQAAIPVVRAVQEVTSVDYAEIVVTVDSKSAGPGMRSNIDEFTRATAKAVEAIGGAARAKAFTIINPSNSPMLRRYVIHMLVQDTGKENEIINSIQRMIADVQTYVPGYRLKSEPIFDGKRISVFLEVEGANDHFPAYSSSLDIITSSATKVAEEIAQYMLGNVNNKNHQPLVASK